MRGFKASTAENCLSLYILELQVSFIELTPNNYLKASLCLLGNCDCLHKFLERTSTMSLL